MPGPLLAPLYRLRARVVGFDFRYDVNMRRFHFGGMLDGRRARERLGYQPSHSIDWPVAAAPPSPNRRGVGAALEWIVQSRGGRP